MEEYAILGGGGMAIEIAEFMLEEGKLICGYYSPEENSLLSSIIPYLGDERISFNPKFFYLVGSGLISLRKKMISFIESNNLRLGSFISKRAYIVPSATFGEGTTIFPFASLSSFVHLGNYVFVNIHASVGHNSVIENNVVIGPGARVTGNCKLCNNVSIGSNSALIPGTILEDGVEIGILTYPPRKVKAGRFILSEPGRILREN